MDHTRKNAKISDEIKSCIVKADQDGKRLTDIAKMYDINVSHMSKYLPLCLQRIDIDN